MSDRELCRHCNGNGVVKLASGVRVCPRCSGDCWEPTDGPLQGWVLDNIYTIARRRVRSLEKDTQDAEGLTATERAAWGHVLRLCEKAGCQGRGVLRDNGGSIESPEAADAVDPQASSTGKPSTREKGI